MTPTKSAETTTPDIQPQSTKEDAALKLYNELVAKDPTRDVSVSIENKYGTKTGDYDVKIETKIPYSFKSESPSRKHDALIATIASAGVLLLGIGAVIAGLKKK